MVLTRTLLLRASRSSWLARRVMRRPFARRAVRRFMPGEELEDALTAASHLAAEGLGSLLTLLGENVASLDDAAATRDHYLRALDEIRSRGLPSAISVKPTQLGLDLSTDVCAEHLERLALKADEIGSTLWLDMEDSSYVDRTLELYRRLRVRHDRVGVALQAYLRRTPADLAHLIPLHPIIRLVKGAYAEPEHVAFPDRRDTDLAFYQLAEELLRAARDGAALPVFGTHDEVLIRRIVASAQDLGLAKEQYEIHMLYGVRMDLQRQLLRAGHRVATLISYGTAWFPWYMRRLAERPANLWFAVRSVLRSS
jgi:proline dehydrogenase